MVADDQRRARERVRRSTCEEAGAEAAGRCARREAEGQGGLPGRPADLRSAAAQRRTMPAFADAERTLLPARRGDTKRGTERQLQTRPLLGVFPGPAGIETCAAGGREGGPAGPGAGVTGAAGDAGRVHRADQQRAGDHAGRDQGRADAGRRRGAHRRIDRQGAQRRRADTNRDPVHPGRHEIDPGEVCP